MAPKNKGIVQLIEWYSFLVSFHYSIKVPWLVHNLLLQGRHFSPLRKNQWNSKEFPELPPETVGIAIGVGDPQEQDLCQWTEMPRHNRK